MTLRAWFDPVPAASGSLLPMHHNWGLVLVSVLVAVAASCMALQVANLVRSAKLASHRQIALASGALALGGGVWAMHFVGMLAMQVPVSVRYQPTLTVVSMLPAVLASALTLRLLARPRVSRAHWLLGGVLVGAGIGAMHYTGMAAMQSSALLRFDPFGFVASLVVAVALAILALWVRFGVARLRLSGALQLCLSGSIMGLAIAGMHYTGMAATRLYGVADPDAAPATEQLPLALLIALMTLVLAGGVAGINGLVRYRHLYQQMQRSESRVRAIVDTAVDGIITIDGQGCVLAYNRSAERLFGWAGAEVIGRNVSMLMPEPDRGQHDGYLRNYLQSGQARIIGIGREVRGLRKNGDVFPMRLAIGEASVGGERLFVGVVTDITERQRMERDLREAKERAEAAVETRSAFLANMSHEIRTPMNAILGFTDLLLARESLDAGQRKSLGTIRQSARHLLMLLNDVLDAAKLDKSALELEQQPFRLRVVCQEVVAMFGAQAEQKGLRLTLTYDADCDEVLGDGLRLRQVLVNLLSNAVKFTEQGTVSLCVSQVAAGVQFQVRDSGIGIPPDRLARLFEPFVQGDASMSRRFGGTGLGTAIAQQLVQLMGGNIAVHSVPGEGSCFTVVVPLQPVATSGGLVTLPRIATVTVTTTEPPAVPGPAGPLDEALVQRVLAQWRRGEWDQVLAERVANALAPHDAERLRQALDDFDLETAARHLQQCRERPE